jgi:hypothetical protein
MRAGLLALFALIVSMANAGDSIVVRVEKKEPSAVLEWHSQLKLPLAGTRPQYKIEWSPDLSVWQPLGDRILGGVSVGDELIRQPITPPTANGFYRISAQIAPAAADGNYSDGIYGYASEFSRKLQQLGQLPLETFVQMYSPTNEYRAALSFDPTTARFFDDFNTDPAVYNQTHTNDQRLTDFRFNADELAIFKTNGFVVSQRMGSYSFADAFYKVYIDDLPVYVSSDALLHAWHRNYVSILSEIESSFLLARFGTLLTNMSAQIPSLQADAANTPLAQGLLDADYYLAVAKSLLSGTNDPGQLNQSARINDALAAVQSLSRMDFDFFGAIRPTDFSQFKVRGHYGDTPYLQNYFRAMMWCSVVDFRFKDKERQSLREFSGSVALTLLLNRSDSLQKWLEYDQIIRAFVGLPDSMNIAQLSDLIAAGNFAPPYSNLSDIYAKLWSSDLGVQNIRGSLVYSPFGPEKYQLPRSFTMMPQRFVVDSWAFSKTVFDDIFWDNDGIPDVGDKVMRRIPSGLDVAFSVLGNDQIVPEIATRIADPNGRVFRDGLPYQHNLAAIRECIDDHDAAFWTNNIYAAWLNCLRAISSPTIGPDFPQAMQTRSWALSSLNTQLASWTELRHDTILYAKQSVTGMILCGYPYGYVEPRPEFWSRLNALATRTHQLLQQVPEEGKKVVNYPGYYTEYSFSTAQLKTNWLATIDRFIAATDTLHSISEKELQHIDLAPNEIDFLQDVVEKHYEYMARGYRTFAGWYPKLFYKPLETAALGINEGSDMWNPMVTDVHTDPTDELSPGSILHEAVGNVNMAFIAVDCGISSQTPIMYAGPVLSHYEFELGPTTRQTDAEWRATVKNNQQPPPPPWTKSFLVPGAYQIPTGID